MRSRHVERSTAPRIVTLSVLAALGLLAGSCAAGDEPDAAQVLATTTIWADVVSEVACGAEVPSMVPAGVDAHSYEPSVRDADLLRGASLVVANGLDLEDGLHDALEGARRDGVDVLELAPLVIDEDDPHEDDHADEADAHDEDGHDHGGQDPHVWMDPVLVAVAVPHIAEALSGVEGLEVGPDEIERCAQDYVAELDGLVEQMSERLDAVPVATRSLVTNHEALGHFAARFDLDVIGAVIPSTSSLAEANPRDLDALEATMRDAGVDVVFAETGGSTALAEALTARLGSGEVVELHVESLDDGVDEPSYVQTMRTNAELVADALG